jgi:hypothetical protein
MRFLFSYGLVGFPKRILRNQHYTHRASAVNEMSESQAIMSVENIYTSRESFSAMHEHSEIGRHCANSGAFMSELVSLSQDRATVVKRRYKSKNDRE